MSKSSRRKTTVRATWTRRQYLEDALAHYEQLARIAEKAESYQAAVRAKMQAVEVRSEIDQLDEAERVMDFPQNLDEHRHEVLRQVRKLRAAAEASNSFIAAAKLLQLEHQLVDAEEARRRNAEKPDDRSLEEVLAEVESKLEDLPPTLRVRLREVRRGEGG